MFCTIFCKKHAAESLVLWRRSDLPFYPYHLHSWLTNVNSKVSEVADKSTHFLKPGRYLISIHKYEWEWVVVQLGCMRLQIRSVFPEELYT